MHALALVSSLLISAGVAAGEQALSAQNKAAAMRAVAPSLVRVEYTLRYDEGEEPVAYGLRKRCPNCGAFHWTLSAGNNLVDEERPLEAAGFMVSDQRVVTEDPMIPRRFVQRIRVRYGDQTVEATPAGYGLHQSAVFLDLDSPLEGTVPLEFRHDRPGPHLVVSYSKSNAAWTINVQALSGSVTETEDGRRFSAVPGGSLIVDADGRAIGMSMNGEWPIEVTDSVSPSVWSTISASALDERMTALGQRCDMVLPRVHLSFRSPRQTAGDMMGYGRYYRNDDDEDNATERDVLGVVVSPETVLVLANLETEVTKRLERIAVYLPDQPPVTATFLSSLSDYGCFLARLDRPATQTIRLASTEPLDLRQDQLVAATIRQQGAGRTVSVGHRRIGQLEVGWKQQIYLGQDDESDRTFLFDSDGALLSIPMARRIPGQQENRWEASIRRWTPVLYIAAILDDSTGHIDEHNRPGSEDEENRLAWIGVELQALDRELARANGVAHLTEDGSTGALVSYVHADSPAMRAGVELGDVLLRLHVKGRTTPLRVDLREEYSYRGAGGFPWDRLDELPAELYDQIPTPWAPASNVLRRSLTEIGFGHQFTAVFSRKGETLRKDLEVVPSPPHYNSTSRYKAQELGLTVRDLTFEVRLYFQKRVDDPGVIISKVEPGSKASVAGIKPYEIITHVNDQLIVDVKSFGELIDQQPDLRLSVLRRNQARQVRITVAD